MITDPPLLTVARNFKRPTTRQLEAIATANTGWLVDAQQGRGSLGAPVKPVFPHDPKMNRCHGTVLTCFCGPDDNLALAAAVSLAKPGDVIIAATEGFAASGFCGDLVAGMMRNRGIAGLVTDGLVRDIAGLREVGLPVFAAGVNPNSPVRNGPGTVGLPIVLGGRMVSSGDLVFADEDGVVTVPLAQADAILAQLETIKTLEAAMLAKVKAGLDSPPWVEEILRSDRTVYVD